MKAIRIPIEALHDMQYDQDYTSYIRGWNEAIDAILTSRYAENVEIDQDDDKKQADQHLEIRG